MLRSSRIVQCNNGHQSNSCKQILMIRMIEIFAARTLFKHLEHFSLLALFILYKYKYFVCKE